MHNAHCTDYSEIIYSYFEIIVHHRIQEQGHEVVAIFAPNIRIFFLFLLDHNFLIILLFFTTSFQSKQEKFNSSKFNYQFFTINLISLKYV